jgi:hypothetical protein
MYLLFVCKPFTYLFVPLSIKQQKFVIVAALFQFFSFVEPQPLKNVQKMPMIRGEILVEEKSVNLFIFPNDKLGEILVEVFLLKKYLNLSFFSSEGQRFTMQKI